jgi:cytochrome c-type biogenesis protein CcmH
MHAHRSSSAVRAIVLAWAAAIVACAAPAEPLDRARAVERRVLAPCCRRQTLEDHESPIAQALRTEIRRRIDGGEQPAAIEDDLVRRYGEDVRAMPRGRDLRPVLGIGVGAVLLLGGLVIVWFMRRRRAVASAAVPAAGAAADPGYEDRLDDELLFVD